MQTVASALSLPAWECGLKCNTDVALVFVDLSLPGWLCVLKSLLEIKNRRTPKSLPAWECGLKYEMKEAAAAAAGHSLRGSVD